MDAVDNSCSMQVADLRALTATTAPRIHYPYVKPRQERRGANQRDVVPCRRGHGDGVGEESSSSFSAALSVYLLLTGRRSRLFACAARSAKLPQTRLHGATVRGMGLSHG